MSDVVAKFEALSRDHREFQSGFRVDHFVIGAAGHPWAQYQQALRELSGNFDALKTEQIELELATVDLEEALVPPRSDADEPENRFARRRREIAGRKAQLRIDTIQRRLRDRVREFAHAFGRAEALREYFVDLSDERRAELDREAWGMRLKTRAAMETLAQGTVSTESLEGIFMLPAEDRDEILAILRPDAELHERLLSWIRSVTGEPVVEVGIIPSDDDVRRIACL